MLTTLSLQPGLAGLGRAALCSAPLLLQRVAAASTAAAMHEAAVAAQQHHRPAHKQKSKDAFSITPFLAKPGQGRRASVDATEWSDRWASRASAACRRARRTPPAARRRRLAVAARTRIQIHLLPATQLYSQLPCTPSYHSQAAPPGLWAAARTALRPQRGRRLALQAHRVRSPRLPPQPPR